MEHILAGGAHIALALHGGLCAGRRRRGGTERPFDASTASGWIGDASAAATSGGRGGAGEQARFVEEQARLGIEDPRAARCDAFVHSQIGSPFDLGLQVGARWVASPLSDEVLEAGAP